jgi:hypothetical protein
MHPGVVKGVNPIFWKIFFGGGWSDELLTVTDIRAAKGESLTDRQPPNLRVTGSIT